MIMAHDILNLAINGSARAHNADQDILADGTYVISATNNSEHLQDMSKLSDSDYILVGMVVSAKKGAAVCQLLQDEHGRMQAPVVFLKRADAHEAEEAKRPVEASRSLTEIPPSEQEELQIRDIEIIPGRHDVRVAGRSVTLTVSEFGILHLLASKPGWVFSREKIIFELHGENHNCTERAVDVQVTGLRKKLGHAGAYIKTVRGVGYRFEDA